MAETLGQTLGLNSIESLLRKGVKTGLLLALLTPWVLWSDSTFPALYPKAIYFRILVEVVFLFYLLLLLKNRSYLPRISPLFLTVFIFIEVLMFSTLNAINPLRSFWGTLERAEGLVLMLHLFAFYVILVSVFRTKEEWMNVLRFFIVSSIPLTVIGVLEKFTTYAIYTDPSASRVSATFGNPLFFAAYLIFVIFIGVFLTIHDYQHRNDQPEEKRAKRRMSVAAGTVSFMRAFLRKRGWIIFGALSLFSFFVFLLTGSRGAWIGVIVGIGLLAVVWFLFLAKGKEQERQRKVALFGAFLILFSFFSFLLLTEAGYIPDTNFVGRYDNLWVKVAEGNFARVLVWDLGYQAWQDAPFLGYGIDSFSFIFDSYYHAGLLEHYPQSLFFDRAHNRVVDLLVFSGIIGLVSYLAVFVVASYQMLKFASVRFHMFAALLFIALLIAYFLQNFVTFDTVTSYVVFFFLLAFLDVNFRKKQPSELSDAETEHSEVKSGILSPILGKISKKGSVHPWVKGAVAVAVVIGMVFLIWTVNIRPFRVNMQLAYAHRALGSGQLNEAIAAIDGALQKTGFLRNEVAYYGTEMLFFAQRRSDYLDEESKKTLAEGLERSAVALEDSLETRSEVLEMRGYLLAARVYITLAFVIDDPSYLDRAEKAAGNAIRLNPEFPVPYRLAGKIRFLQDREEEALILFSKAYEIDNDLQVSLEWLGESLVDAGQLERGTEALRRAMRIGEFYTEQQFNIQKVWALGGFYERAGNYAGMAEFYEEVISFYPGTPHPQLFASLTQVYILMGDSAKARAAADRMIELYPQLEEQANKFLSDIEEAP